MVRSFLKNPVAVSVINFFRIDLDTFSVSSACLSFAADMDMHKYEMIELVELLKTEVRIKIIMTSFVQLTC